MLFRIWFIPSLFLNYFFVWFFLLLLGTWVGSFFFRVLLLLLWFLLRHWLLLWLRLWRRLFFLLFLWIFWIHFLYFSLDPWECYELIVNYRRLSLSQVGTKWRGYYISRSTFSFPPLFFMLLLVQPATLILWLYVFPPFFSSSLLSPFHIIIFISFPPTRAVALPHCLDLICEWFSLGEDSKME